jgi:ParB family chromosome partitioning protein
MSERPISSILIGMRHRRDLGDVTGLAQSIREVGLLQPIVVTPAGQLIAGERRLAACKQLGWLKISTTTIDMEQLVFAERAENIDRKDFTLEERVAIGEEIEKLLGERRGSPSKKVEKVSTI